MPRPYFVADEATVTVLKPVASSAFGSYKLSVPEGVDISDIYEFAAPGNELGYVASLAPAGQRVGGFARRFVRADVNVTAADVTDPDWVPASDVDKVLTESAARVEGDFFLESDITKAGLGPWIPFTHFEQGDLATVEIWGRRVPLPVTRIEPKVTDHDENDWSVHVGGQLVSDDDARLVENELVRRAVVDSRREIAGVSSVAKSASKTANSAASGVKDLNETLAGPSANSDDVLAEMQALAEQLTEHGEDAPAGLIPAYMASNNERWRMQAEIDAAQDRALAVSEETMAMHESWIVQMQDTMEQLQQAQTQILMMNFNQTTAENEWVKFTRSGNRVSWTVKPGWTGSMTMLASVGIHSGGAYARDTYFRLLNVPNPEEDWMESVDGVGSIQATIMVNPGVPKTVSPSIADQTVGNDWTTLTSWTLPKDAEVMLSTQLWWVNKSFLDSYDLRVTVNGADATSSASQEGAPLIGQGRRKHVAAMDRRRLPAGSVLAVQARSNHGNAWNRQINGASAKITWIDEG